MDGKKRQNHTNRRALVLYLFLMGSCTSSSGTSSGSDEPVEPSDTVSSVQISEHHSGEVVFRLPNLDRNENFFAVLFTENGCASGNRADDRFRIEVEEDQATIAVSIFITEQEGDQDCPSNPWTPASITLDEAIGTRQITGVRQPIDDLELPLQVTASTQVQVPSDITFIDSDETLWTHSEIRCEDLGVPHGKDFQTDQPQLDSTSLFAQALAAIEGPYDSMYRHQSLDGSTIVVQFFQGSPVASVTVFPHQLGWKASASRCVEMPEYWSPGTYNRGLDKADAGAEATDEDLQQITNLLTKLEGLTLADDQLVFTDPSRRCDVMVGVEDVLEGAGWSIYGSRLHIDEMPPAGPNQEFERQAQTTIFRADGRVISLFTVPDGTLQIAAVPGEPQTQLRESDITPCFLDSPIAVTILPAVN